MNSSLKSSTMSSLVHSLTPGVCTCISGSPDGLHNDAGGSTGGTSDTAASVSTADTASVVISGDVSCSLFSCFLASSSPAAAAAVAASGEGWRGSASSSSASCYRPIRTRKKMPTRANVAQILCGCNYAHVRVNVAATAIQATPRRWLPNVAQQLCSGWNVRISNP